MNLSPAAFQIAACVATASGAASLYLGAPNQRWLSRRLPARLSRISGAALLLIGVALERFAITLTRRGFPNRGCFDSTFWLGGGQRGWVDHILKICVIG
ncbi:MAG: hypothetical protein FJX45_11270 [Alphaproteobacteria bacterium]|nr:hypothetical protein [Alphaproteobacteria bacterium]